MKLLSLIAYGILRTLCALDLEHTWVSVENYSEGTWYCDCAICDMELDRRYVAIGPMRLEAYELDLEGEQR